jgi:transposase
LRAEEEAVLEGIVQSQTGRRDRVARAVALLAVAHGHSYAAAAQQAGWHTHVAVAKLVRRFNARGLEALDIAAGRGRRASPAQAAQADPESAALDGAAVGRPTCADPAPPA